jgi:hypothetical protein
MGIGDRGRVCGSVAHQQDSAEFEDGLVRGWTREFGEDPERIA